MKIISEEILDKQIKQVKEEVYRKDISAFKEIGHSFLKEEITSSEFKASSGGIGVYAQRSGKEFMLRLRILSGVLDVETLKLIQGFAKDYSLDFIHFTTRQAIQLHNLEFDDVIDIMNESLDNNLITRGGGGNYPRNVSLSPLSGVEKEEAFDVTPYAVFVNKYFVSQMNTYKLPRKFKVAFSNNGQDSANASIADLGFLAVIKEGIEYFQVYIGGSLGPNGDISVPYDELIQPGDVLYHVEALLSLFKEEGDYQNKGKARIRYIVKRMGNEAFLNCYKKHLKKVKESKTLDFELRTVQQVTNEESSNILAVDYPDVISQKQKNLYSVNIHPQGGILKVNDLIAILDFVDRIPDVQLRLSMEESLLIRNLTGEQVKELLELTKDIRNTTKLSRSISCIGTPTCQIGIQSSQTLLAEILHYFKTKDFLDDILPSIHISGCMNSCSRHQVNKLGFQGKKKRINSEMKDAYSIHIGGSIGKEGTHLAKEYGDLLASDIPVFLYELAVQIKEHNIEFDEYLNLYKGEFETLINHYLV